MPTFIFLYDIFRTSGRKKYRHGQAEVYYENRGRFVVVVTKVIENGEDRTAHYKHEEPEEFELMQHAALNNWESVLEEQKG